MTASISYPFATQTDSICKYNKNLILSSKAENQNYRLRMFVSSIKDYFHYLGRHMEGANSPNKSKMTIIDIFNNLLFTNYNLKHQGMLSLKFQLMLGGGGAHL